MLLNNRILFYLLTPSILFKGLIVFKNKILIKYTATTRPMTARIIELFTNTTISSAPTVINNSCKDSINIFGSNSSIDPTSLENRFKILPTNYLIFRNNFFCTWTKYDYRINYPPDGFVLKKCMVLLKTLENISLCKL